MKQLLLLGLPLWVTAIGALGLLAIPDLSGSFDPATQSAAVKARAHAASDIRWREIVAPPLSERERARLIETTRACLTGPLPGRSELVRAGDYPLNHCSCLAAGVLTLFSPDETQRLDGALNHARRAPHDLGKRWLALRKRCMDVPRNRRLPPFPSPASRS